MHTVSIKLDNEELTKQISGDVSIHDGLSQQELNLPHGCLAGSCGACKVEVLEGPENIVAPGPIESNTLESIKETIEKKDANHPLTGKTIRLSCRAKIIGPVSIRPIKKL